MAYYDEYHNINQLNFLKEELWNNFHYRKINL